MKYIVMDQRDGDLFTTECGTLDEALEQAREQWDCLTRQEQDRREAFYVLESADPDPESWSHLDGTPVKTWKKEEMM